MTLDTNIALGFKGMQLNDPMEQFGRAMTLSNMGVQNQFMQQKMDEQTRLSALAQKRQQAFSDSGGDPAKFRQSLVSMGMYDDVQAHDKSALETEKTRGEIDHRAAETNARLQKLVSGVATGIHAGGTIEHAMHGSQLLRQYGATRQADIVDDWLQKNPEATPDMVRQAVAPYIASELDSKSVLMPDYKDTGGQLVNVNPNAQFAPINKTQTPESIASNQVSREGHQVSREGHKVTMRGQDLTNARAKDTETRLSTAQQRLDQQNEQAISGAKGSKALIAEMRQLVKDNPRGTATPLAGPARLAESMKGIFDTGAEAGPAIRFNQLRDTLLATVDGLRRDGRMSNQDRQRLENAVGSGMTTPANTIEALNTVEDIIDRMGGNQGQAADPQNDYLARRKKLLGY